MSAKWRDEGDKLFFCRRKTFLFKIQMEKNILEKNGHLFLQLGHHEESAPLTQLPASVRMSRSHHRIKNTEKTYAQRAKHQSEVTISH
jgi:hypothetical protein